MIDRVALLRDAEQWMVELENLLAIRAAYYGEERLLKMDVEMGRRLIQALREKVEQ